MANAEQLLHEAQYAFHSISYGESRENKRNAARARSLCKKIISRYPVGIEADEAHAILRRLGEEAYLSNLAMRHRHISQAEHHQPQSQAQPMRVLSDADHTAALNWSGLIAAVVGLPKFILALIVVAGFFLFGLFGPFLIVPLIALVLLTGPFRDKLKPKQRKELNEFVVRVNDYLASRQS